MGKVYFILDITNNNPKISSRNLTRTLHYDNNLDLLMLKDSDYCGKAQLYDIIKGYVVSMECSTQLEYLEKGMRLIELYQNNQEEVFNMGIYQKIKKFDFIIDPQKNKKYFDDEESSISLYITEINDGDQKYLYYSNPEFHFKNYFV